MSKKHFDMKRASAKKPVREKQIEDYLRKQTAKRLGGTARKYNSPGRAAEPDRILTWGGLCVFVEAKAPRKKPTPAQYEAHDDLRKDGQLVFWVNSYETVDELMDTLELL